MNKSKTTIFLILLVLVFSLGVFDFSYAQGTGTGTTFINPLTYDTVEQITTSLLDNLQKIVALLAIVFIVIGGLMYIFSAGDDKKIETAKKIITAAIIGFVIVLIAPSLLKEIGDILGWTDTTDTTTDALTLYKIATNVLTTLLSISGIIAIIFLVIGGITYMGGFSTAIGSGDSKKNVETGKKIITNSIIGIAIIMGALVIVNQISVLFG